jgi:hypothetical protein
LPYFSWNNTTKRGEIYPRTPKLPNGYKIYEMALNIPYLIKLSIPWPPNLPKFGFLVRNI